mgnify:CR=1 FL=1
MGAVLSPEVLEICSRYATGGPGAAYSAESLNSLTRVMNRLGRGYSFEALRGKMLFTEGAHQHKLSRPKFERRREPEPELAAAKKAARSGLPDDVVEFGLPVMRDQFPHLPVGHNLTGNDFRDDERAAVTPAAAAKRHPSLDQVSLMTLRTPHRISAQPCGCVGLRGVNRGR